MKKIIYSLLGIIILIGGIYFFYPTAKSRYLNSQNKKLDFIEDSAKQKKSPANSDEEKEAIIPTNQTIENEIKSDSINITVTPKDCDNECSRFKEYQEQKYCEEICGISDLYDYPEEEEEEENNDSDEENNDNEGDDSQEENNQEQNCEEKKGLEKDYCLKDLAILKTNFELCEKINDSGIRKTCKNRVTENLLEQEQEE